MSASLLIELLESLKNPDKLPGMQRFGINVDRAFGISMPTIRSIAKEYRKNHELALELWETGWHEARILASLIDDSKKVTSDQMDRWVLDFNSWDLCDQCCCNLFNRSSYAHEKAIVWANRSEEFVKRAGFVMMATLAVHDKKGDDEKFEAFFPYIVREAEDSRNFVKKAVNWALRQIGKRNTRLNFQARACAEIISEQPFKSSKWIASDALRELTNEKIVNGLT